LLQQQQNTSLPMIQIGKISDLLKAKPIMEMAKEFGFEAVLNTVKKALVKCSSSMNIQMVPAAIETIAEDLIEMYKCDSVEDIVESLKKGRRGVYSSDRDAKTYGKLNMEVISVWMAKHLDEKYQEKEKSLKEQKPIQDDPDFDAKKFYEEGRKYLEAQSSKEKKTTVGLHVPNQEEKKRQYELLLPDCKKSELERMKKGAETNSDQLLVKMIIEELKTR